MKILVFEYICGGGFCAENLPDSLAQEGLLMLKALLNDLNELKEHQISLLLDWRFLNTIESDNVICINKEDHVINRFESALTEVDAVWVIAPESKHILFNLAQCVETANKLLLLSSSSAIAQTSDKWQTFKQLSKHHIPSVNTAILNQNSPFFSEGTVIKARDGVGCEDSFFISSQSAFQSLLTQLQPEKYIVQPFMQGESLSLSALFKKGQAQLLCINRQHIKIKHNQFKLSACEVNIEIDSGDFQKLCSQIANAFPCLWGYVGIDLIRNQQQLWVLEINPRLTSSYAGIKQALGINVAKEVLQLLHSDLHTTVTPQRTIMVDLY